MLFDGWNATQSFEANGKHACARGGSSSALSELQASSKCRLEVDGLILRKIALRSCGGCVIMRQASSQR